MYLPTHSTNRRVRGPQDELEPEPAHTHTQETNQNAHKSTYVRACTRTLSPLEETSSSASDGRGGRPCASQYDYAGRGEGALGATRRVLHAHARAHARTHRLSLTEAAYGRAGGGAAAVGGASEGKANCEQPPAAPLGASGHTSVVVPGGPPGRHGVAGCSRAPCSRVSLPCARTERAREADLALTPPRARSSSRPSAVRSALRSS